MNYLARYAEAQNKVMINGADLDTFKVKGRLQALVTIIDAINEAPGELSKIRKRDNGK